MNDSCIKATGGSGGSKNLISLFWKFLLRCTRCKKTAWKIFFLAWVIFFVENHDLPVNTLRKKPLNFVTFQYRNLKVFRVVYLQANRDFHQVRTKNSSGFLHLVLLNEIFQNKIVRPPCGLKMITRQNNDNSNTCLH